MRIRAKYITKNQTIFAIILGVVGGSYIWIPPLKQYTEEQTLQQKSRVNSFDGIDQQSIQK